MSNRLTVDLHIKHIDATEVLTMSLSIFKLCFNQQRYHLQVYWAHFIDTLLMMSVNASIIVHNVENWNAFIIIHLILDMLRTTTKATPSVRPSQYIVHVDINADTPLPYSLIANTAVQFLGGNLFKKLVGYSIYVRKCVYWVTF